MITVRLCLQTELLTLLHMMPKQMTIAIQNRTAEAISVMITAQIIGKTVICAHGLTPPHQQEVSIGFAEIRRKTDMSAEQVLITTKPVS